MSVVGTGNTLSSTKIPHQTSYYLLLVQHLFLCNRHQSEGIKQSCCSCVCPSHAASPKRRVELRLL